MSQFCKTELCSTVDSSINYENFTSACKVTDAIFSSFSVDRLDPPNRKAKLNADNLPDPNTVPNGHIVYLDDAKVPVIASNGAWIGFDGRQIGFTSESQIWGWGSSSSGILANGVLFGSYFTFPTRELTLSTDWCQVSITSNHAGAIKTSGELWGWGYNSCGQLGNASTTSQNSPVRERSSSTDWCQVSAGDSHKAAIKTSGQLWTWGNNACGRLGDGTITTRTSPVREISSSTDWCQVSAGSSNTGAIKTSGELWMWGTNNSGVLGDGTTVSKCSPVREFCSATDWCQVNANFSNGAIKTSGELWVWGQGFCGALGDGTTVNKCSPVREFCSATDWCQVSTQAAIKTSGQLWTWGVNNCGQLGDGTTVSKCSPVREFCSATDWCQVHGDSGEHTAVKTSGQIWSWGCNVFGGLGDGTNISKCSPVREISSATDWCQANMGNNTVLAIRVTNSECR